MNHISTSSINPGYHKNGSDIFTARGIFFVFVIYILASCTNVPNPVGNRNIEVVINDIPFNTDVYKRIPYTLRAWEWEKEGLKLQQIEILDYNTNATLQTIEKESFPVIHKDPLTPNGLIELDKLSHYYISIQLPVELNKTPPSKIFHKFKFRDTVKNKELTVEGGIFMPRLTEAPLAISSPVKGDNWLFINQSTNEYHFFTMFFTDRKLWRGERFAFDNIKLNDEMDDMLDGDPKVNESYFNYKDTLYAVANGTVLKVVDGRPENRGDARDIKFANLDEYAGNYLVLDIGNSRYVYYAHCVPNKFMVTQGKTVKEGDPIALLGNSGNSTGPHLHFQITDGPHIFFSNGLPFVIKKYTKTGNSGTGPSSPVAYTNAMMEEQTVISF